VFKSFGSASNGNDRRWTAKLLTKDEARRIAVNIAKLPSYCRVVKTPFLFLRGLQRLAGLGVDKMNSPASGTRHGFVNLAICYVISNSPLRLQTSSWATIDEDNGHLPAIWEQRRSMALLISADILLLGPTLRAR